MVGGCLDEAENVFELEEVRTTPTGVAFASDDVSMKVAAKINGPATAATFVLQELHNKSRHGALEGPDTLMQAHLAYLLRPQADQTTQVSRPQVLQPFLPTPPPLVLANRDVMRPSCWQL